MATGFYLPDGRDFSSVFTSGNAGLNTGFKTANGTDIGNQFVAGNSGITTNYIPIGGGDLGSKLGYIRTVNLITSTLSCGTDTSYIADKSQRTHTFNFNVNLNTITSIHIKRTIRQPTAKQGFILRISTSSDSYDLPDTTGLHTEDYSVKLMNASSVILYIYRHNYTINGNKHTAYITIDSLSVTGY